MVIKAIIGHHVKSDGTSQIKIYIYSNGIKEYLPTAFYVKPDQFEKGRVKKSRPNADYINTELSLKMAELERTWLTNKGINPAELRKKKKETTFFDFSDILLIGMRSGKILNNGQEFSNNTIKNYVTNINYLKDFQAGLNWNGVTEEFYNDFIAHLRGKNYSPNTIAKAIKTLMSIMKRGRVHHINNEFLSFKAAYVDVETIALSPDEIDLIMKAKLEKHLESERDRFLLSYNLLLRFGDSITVNKNDLVKRGKKWFINIVHQKTKNTAIIPLFEKSLKILKKYNYKMPKTANQVSNRNIKSIAKVAGIKDMVKYAKIVNGRPETHSAEKHNFVTTHTARRSMATNLYLAGFDLKQIQLMGGWKSMVVLEKYLKVDKLQNAIKASEHPFFN